jgi:hypothetical protein
MEETEGTKAMTSVALGGRVGVKGKSGTAAAVATAIAAGTLAFMVTGKSAEIAVGTPMTAFLDREIRIAPTVR